MLVTEAVTIQRAIERVSEADMPPNVTFTEIFLKCLAHATLGFILAALVSWLIIKLWRHMTGSPTIRTTFKKSIIWRSIRWGALASVAIDIDHVTRLFGHPNGRVFHKPLAYLAAVILVINLMLIGLKFLKRARGAPIAETEIHTNILIISICVCVIAHVLEDFWLNLF